MHVGDGSSASALLVRDDRVVAQGDARDLARAAPRAEAVDLRGGLMVPGWIDAHAHFMWWALQRSQLDLGDTDTLGDALARIEERARTLAPGAWLIRGRFDKNRWGRWPTARELDAVTAGHPAALRSRDGHARWLNSEALRVAGITGATADPPGGSIERDNRGAPTGILKENANALADAVIPPPTDDECLAAVRQGQREAWRAGLTGIEDLESGQARAAFERMAAAGELGLRVAMGIPYEDLESALDRGARTGDGGVWLRTGHLKVFSDGALGSQTAALEEPYEGGVDRGILTIEPGRLAADVARAAAGGIAVAIHAIGDRAVRISLDAIAASHRVLAAPHKIEHLQLVRPEDVGRFAELGVVASMQPLHATSDRDLADRHWGGRARHAYPWRALARAGAVLAFGSDAPVEPIEPLLGLFAAVARRRRSDESAWHPEQALSIEQALAAYAAGSARAIGRHELGSLAIGSRCDATILDRDIRDSEAELAAARVTGTVSGGVIRFADGIG